MPKPSSATTAATAQTLPELDAAIEACRACPRLVEWREAQGRVKVARHRNDDYWSKPVPGFGDPDARVVLIGLAPGAHGSNRTGRMFTGDASGDFLFPALHAVGFGSQPDARRRGDGLELRGCRIVSAARCAPPANKPTPDELARCLPFLDRELQLLPNARVLVALGSIGWDAALNALAALGHQAPKPKPKFGHGAEAKIGPYTLVGSYHPSQQNTFTGKLTQPMLRAVLARAVELAERGAPSRVADGSGSSTDT
jgi:uracil-DNA glycosylase family 4